MRKKFGFIAAAFATIVIVPTAYAAKMKSTAQADAGSSYSAASHSHQDMQADLTAHYVRDTNPAGITDSAVRFSVGGMLNQYFGIDVQGLYAARSRDYLIGSNLRFVPNEWLFAKAGLGGYADKKTREIQITPLVGAGMMAKLNRDYYLVTEATYFQVQGRNNIGIGAGLGMLF